MHNNLNDTGKLILRLTLGILILLHGIFKLRHGIDGIQGMVAGMGMPAFVAYGVFAGEVLGPLLLIVGGDDPVVLDLNRRAQQALRCVNELAVVPGATHLFEEPGALEKVADLAREWFRRYLRPAVSAS